MFGVAREYKPIAEFSLIRISAALSQHRCSFLGGNLWCTGKYSISAMLQSFLTSSQFIIHGIGIWKKSFSISHSRELLYFASRHRQNSQSSGWTGVNFRFRTFEQKLRTDNFGWYLRRFHYGKDLKLPCETAYISQMSPEYKYCSKAPEVVVLVP